MLLILVISGGFGAAFLGALAGVVVSVSQRDTFPREHDPEREIELLTLRFRSPWRARIHRWLGD